MSTACRFLTNHVHMSLQHNRIACSWFSDKNITGRIKLKLKISFFSKSLEILGNCCLVTTSMRNGTNISKKFPYWFIFQCLWKHYFSCLKVLRKCSKITSPVGNPGPEARTASRSMLFFLNSSTSSAKHSLPLIWSNSG